jgi:hypothetical protein
MRLYTSFWTQFCEDVCGVFAIGLYLLLDSFVQKSVESLQWDCTPPSGTQFVRKFMEFAMRLQLSQNCELDIDILLLVGQVVNHLFYWMSSPGMTKLTWRSWKSVCAQCLWQDSSGEHVRIILHFDGHFEVCILCQAITFWDSFANVAYHFLSM